MKHWLRPKGMRAGQPFLQFVEKVGDNYILGTYFDLQKKEKYRGIGVEYNSLSRMGITQQLYMAFLTEHKIMKALRSWGPPTESTKRRI